jgi:hypothetical protein
MAERYLLAAQYQGGPTAPPSPSPAAEELAQRARALEGPRALAYGSPQPGPPRSLETSRLAFGHARPADEVYVDGVPTREGTPVAAGQHHVQVFRAGRRLWAGWADLGAPLRFPDPSVACDSLDVGGAEERATGPEALPGVLCPYWAIARSAAPGAVQLAECRGARCGPWHWLQSPLEPGALTTRNPDRQEPAAAADSFGGWSPWMTWTVIGVGVVAASGLILWQADAFASPPRATEFAFTGPSAAAIPF